MKTLVNLSVKKTGTSFVHNLMRYSGVRVAPEKEYYTFPRNTQGFLNLATDVTNAYDSASKTYFSANETTAVDENDRIFIERLLALNDFSVEYIHKLQNPFQRVSASLQRLSLLRHSYPATEAFVVSDPNFLTDLCALSVGMNATELEMVHSILRAEEIEFFSIIRDPVDAAISLAGLYSREVSLQQLCADEFLENIASRCRQFAMIGFVGEKLGIKTRAYRFDYVIDQPFDFVLRLHRDFGISLSNMEQDALSPKNPNPGSFLPDDVRSVQRQFFSNRLDSEIALFSALKEKDAQGAVL